MSNFCTECGAAKHSAAERFCGACGAPFAPAAPTVAAATAAPPAPPRDPDVTAVRQVWRPPAGVPAVGVPAAGTGTVPAGQAPLVAPASAPWDAVPAGAPGRRRGLAVPLIALTVVAALAGAGLVAWQVLGPRGGASDPAAAVSGFVEALAAQDPVAALDMVVPGEVAGLDEVYVEAAERLDSLGMTSGDGVSAAFSLELTDLAYDVTEVGEDVAVVRLAGGSYRIDVDPSTLPPELDDLRQQEADSWSGDLLDDLGAERREDAPRLMTVQVDGRWYVSLLGSYADFLFDGGVLDPDSDTRESFAAEGIRLADPDAVAAGVEPITGADLEEVMDNLSSAVASGSPERLLANLPAEQVVGLLPFMGTFQDLLRDEAVTFSADMTDLAVGDTVEDGDLLTVTVQRASLQAVASDPYDTEYADLTLEGTCGYVSTEYDQDSGCLPGTFLETMGVEEPFLVLREVAEGYQLDPVATAAAYARTAVESVPDMVVRDLLRALDDEDEDAACFALGLGELC